MEEKDQFPGIGVTGEGVGTITNPPDPDEHEMTNPPRKENCAGCVHSAPRTLDRWGRESTNHIACKKGKPEDGNHIRNRLDWCHHWTARA